MRLFLGVDGGQSSTTALIGDGEGRVLGRGTAGPCNHAASGEGRAKLERAVSQSVAAACAAAGLDGDAIVFDAACFGMSGGPDDKRAILERILRARRLIVTHDAAIALAGATSDGVGIAVIAGTGSIAYGRNGAGDTARAGGWGHIYGDEGGAFDIVRQALRAALRMEEGWGPSTVLRQVLIDAGGRSSVNELLHLWYGSDWPRSRVAMLAPLVDAAAAHGDAVAARILQDAAQELARLAGAVRGQLWRAGETAEVAYIGGVFESALLRERFRILLELEEGNRCHAPLNDPPEGALREAVRSCAGAD